MSDTAGRTAAITGLLADYVTERARAGFPDAATELAVRSLVDTVGVAVAGRRADSVRTLTATLGGGAPGGATVLSDGARMAADDAALIGGTAAHALDFDDVAVVTHAHPSAVIWPALFAAIGAEQVSGAELLDAYIVGYDVAAAVACGMDLHAHYQLGWHTTSSIGIFSAVAAVAYLLKLTNAQVRCALGLAGSLAFGSCQNFGTMTKPLHAGMAARQGVLAARLAAHGFTADPDQLESPQGYYAMYTTGADQAGVDACLSDGCALARYGLVVKRFPCCLAADLLGATALGLYERDRPAPAELGQVRVTLQAGGFTSLAHHEPQTGLEGKFSGEYVVAAALLDGHLRLATFTDEAVNRDDVQRLIKQMTTVEAADADPGSGGWPAAFAQLDVSTMHGAHQYRLEHSPGQREVSRGDLEAKFKDCLEFSEAPWDAAKLLRELWAVNQGAEFSLSHAFEEAAR